MKNLFSRISAALCTICCSVLISGGLSLKAQTSDVHFGLSLNLAQPLGDFGGQNFVDSRFRSDQNDRFYTGVGLQLFADMPLDRNTILRGSFGITHFQGKDTLAGRLGDVTLGADDMSLGVEALFFLHGAKSRLGTYALLGASVDFMKYSVSEKRLGVERFDNTRITDNALNFGIGHSFRFEDMRFVVELSFHKVISHGQLDGVELPRADAIRFGYGVVF